MAEGNNPTRCSDDHCKEYSILNNRHYVVLSGLLDGTQFCEAFFHVPELSICDQGRWDKKNDMQCLDEERCRVFDKDNKLQAETNTPERRQPKHVVCLVVLKKGENVEYKAIYENCVINEGIKTHAEEFFDEDARNGKLKEILEGPDIDGVTAGVEHVNIKENSSQAAPSESNTLKLCMYITLQPCHKSTPANEKSCTDRLITLYRDRLKPRGIEFVVKPTFIHKAYWANERQAKKGVIKLCQEEYRTKKGFQIEAMKKADWSFLKNELCPSCSKQIFAPGGSYEGSERKKLDVFIRRFLGDIKAQATTRGSATQATARSSTTQASTSSSGTQPTTSNLQRSTTPCSCKSTCVQEDGKKKRCPCETAGKYCHEACKCVTRGKPCKNKKNG